jgi:hypothetical protein
MGHVHNLNLLGISAASAIGIGEQGEKMWSEVGGEEVINLVRSTSEDKYT